MEYIAVVLRDTAFVGIIGADIEVPHREGRVDILRRDEDGVCGDTDIINIQRVIDLVLAQRGLRHILVQKIIAGS